MMTGVARYPLGRAVNKSALPLVFVLLTIAAGAAAGITYIVVKPQTPAAIPAPAAKVVDEQAVEKIVAERVRAELEKVKQQVLVKPEVKRPPEARKYTFDEAWTEALAIHAKLNLAEEKATAKTIDRLGGIDAEAAKSFVTTFRKSPDLSNPDLLATFDPSLAKLGLNDLLSRGRRNRGFSGIVFNIKSSSRITWTENSKPEDLVLAAEYWGSLNLPTALDAKSSLEDKVKPPSTEAIRAVEALPGGDEWLKKLK